MAPHETFVTVYEVVAKRDRQYDGTITQGNQLLMQDLINGWKLDMGAGADTMTTGSGDAQFTYNTGDTTAQSEARFISVNSSREFRNAWKVIRSKRYRLNAGDDIFWRTTVKPRTWDPVRENVNDSDQTRDVIKGYTKMILVKFHGIIGHSNGANGS